MAMTDDEFDALVHRPEAQSRQHPGAYKAKVLALGALGYAYVLAVVGVLVLLLSVLGLLVITGKGALLAKKLAIPLIALAALSRTRALATAARTRWSPAQAARLSAAV